MSGPNVMPRSLRASKTCKSNPLRRAGLLLVALGACSWLVGGAAAGGAAPKASTKPKALTPFFKTLARVPAAGRDWRELIDRNSRFKLQVPADWVDVPAASYGDAYNVVAGEATPVQGFSANLNVVQQLVEETTTLKASMVEDVAKKMESGEQGIRFKVVERAFTPLGGKDCMLLGGVFDSRGRTLRSVQLRMVHRQVSYLFTFTSLEASYPSYEPLFARIMRTVVFERADGTWPTPPAVAHPSPAPLPSGKPAPGVRAVPTPSPGPGHSPSPVPSVSPLPGPSSAPSPSPSGVAPAGLPSASPVPAASTSPSR
jgi:hypothetical protein